MITLDIIIPCYRAAATLPTAVASALRQAQVRQIWLVDDASDDGTAECIAQLAAQEPRIRPLFQTHNQGAAAARNRAAWASDADILAFLDADDAYQDRAFEAALLAFEAHPNLGSIRLRLEPIGLPPHYVQHENFAAAWHNVCMSTAGNLLIRRPLFLAAGGFPSDELFRRFGGEDGALGIALTRASVVGTLFGATEAGVCHTCHPQAHVYRLLDSMLWGKMVAEIGAAEMAQAEAVSAAIVARLRTLAQVLGAPQCGVMPLYPQWD